MPKNYMEDMVDHLLFGVLEKYDDLCRCERCTEDIKAIALNRLKPLYVVRDKGTSYVKLNEMSLQFKADLTTEIMKAIEMVKTNPKHDQ